MCGSCQIKAVLANLTQPLTPTAGAPPPAFTGVGWIFGKLSPPTRQIYLLHTMAKPGPFWGLSPLGSHCSPFRHERLELPACLCLNESELGPIGESKSKGREVVEHLLL